MSWFSLFHSLTHSVSESVTRSPIELFSTAKNILSDSCVEAGVSLFVRHVNVKGKLAGGKILKEMIYYQPSSPLGSEKKRGFSWKFIFFHLNYMRTTIVSSLGESSEFDKLLNLLLGAVHHGMVEGAVVRLDGGKHIFFMYNDENSHSGLSAVC